MLGSIGTRLVRRGNTFRCSSASSSLTPAAAGLAQSGLFSASSSMVNRKGFSTQIVEMRVKSNRTGAVRNVSFFVVGIYDRQLTGKHSAEETLKALQVAQKAEVMTGVFPCLEEFYVDKMLDVTSKETLQATQKILPASQLRAIKRCGYVPCVQAAVAGKHNLVPIGQGSWERFDRGCNALFRNPYEVVQFYRGVLMGDWLRYFSWGDEEPDTEDLNDFQESAPHLWRAVYVSFYFFIRFLQIFIQMMIFDMICSIRISIEEPAQYSALRAMLEAHYALHRKPDAVTAAAVIVCNNRSFPCIVDALETFSG